MRKILKCKRGFQINLLWDEFARRLLQVYVAVSSEVHNTGLGSLPVKQPAFSIRVILSWTASRLDCVWFYAVV